MSIRLFYSKASCHLNLINIAQICHMNIVIYSRCYKNTGRALCSILKVKFMLLLNFEKFNDTQMPCIYQGLLCAPQLKIKVCIFAEFWKVECANAALYTTAIRVFSAQEGNRRLCQVRKLLASGLFMILLIHNVCQHGLGVRHWNGEAIKCRSSSYPWDAGGW